MILAALALEKVFSAAQDFEDLLKLDAQLLDDLLALADVGTGTVTVLALVIAAIATPLDGLELRELLFPVPQYVRFYRTQITDFTDGEVALARYWR